MTEDIASGLTYEGAPGYARTEKSELFLLAVSNMVGEDTFYEGKTDRDRRFRHLVETVAQADPQWTAEFFRWLRTDANMRSASLVGAIEAARAMLAAKVPGARKIVDSVLQRADEPGEALAYWMSRYGRAIPKPVKRGIGDAAARLYREYSLLKYDTASHSVRFADVLDLTHPAAKTAEQGDLFEHALARRHNRDTTIPATLPMLVANERLRKLWRLGNEMAAPEFIFTADDLREAGMTWEDVLSLAGPKVDKAKLWEALIPTMGFMAIIRNLRNFDEAGVSDEVAATVAARLADPEQVATSRQFPFRFLSAYRSVSNLRWAHPLEKALAASLSNIPRLDGRTLILVDRSPSMFPMYSYMHTQAVRDQVTKTGVTLADRAAIFGVALALRCADATVVQYGMASELVTIPKGASLLPMLNKFKMIDGTATFAAAGKYYAKHDRVVIITDEQTTAGYDPIPQNIPVYTWNLGGYKPGHLPSGLGQRHTFGGLTDAAFRMIPLVEAGRNADWATIFGS